MRIGNTEQRSPWRQRAFSLLAGAVLFPLPEGSTAGAEALPLGEFLLAGLALGGIGAVAGNLSSRPALVALLPLLWGPSSGLLGGAQLAALPLYGHLALGCAWAALGLALALRAGRLDTAMHGA